MRWATWMDRGEACSSELNSARVLNTFQELLNTSSLFIGHQRGSQAYELSIIKTLFFLTVEFTENKAVVCAISASYISTFAGYPLDSLKSRLQTSRNAITVPRLASQVFQEEGIKGFYRGLWIPLFTISFVRAYLTFLNQNPF